MHESGLTFASMDTDLIEHCLSRAPRGWEDVVDRLIGVVFHVIDHTAHSRQVFLAGSQRDSIGESVFAAFKHNDYELLRQYRGRASLATYTAVVARRIVVRLLLSAATASPKWDAPSPLIQQPHASTVFIDGKDSQPLAK